MPTLSKLCQDARKKYPITRLDRYIAEVEKGYPTTREPTMIPKIQDKIVEWKAVRHFGFSFGQEGVQHAHDDSLACIHERIKGFAKMNNMVEILIPKHVLTYSCAFGTNWKVGNSCQEFVPVNMELKEGGFFTYRMLSKHDQATFYNYDGVEYLVGICYYVQLHESRLITTQIDTHIFNHNMGSSEAYPPRNRFKTALWHEYQVYGRYCNTAGKRVCVKWPRNVHVFFNLRTGDRQEEDCEECSEEAKTYKFVEVEEEASPPVKETIVVPIAEKLKEMKMEDVEKKDTKTRIENYIAEVEKGYPTTREPTIIPKIQDKIVGWKTDGMYKDYDRFGISLGQEGVQHAHDDFLHCIEIKRQCFARFNQNGASRVLIPKHALTFSYAFGTNWKVGNSCQEFLPVDMELKEGGFFTYRMLSKHDQATFYNYDGVEYLVGVCYYLQHRRSLFFTTEIDRCIFDYEICSSEEYPPRNRFETDLWHGYRIYGRYCKTAGKRVCVFWPENKDPVHACILYTQNRQEEDCEECREEAMTYKFVEVEKEAPTSPPVENIIATPIVEKLDELKVDDVKQEDTELLLKNYIAEVEKGYPTTREPTIIPKIQEKIVGWKTDGEYWSNDLVGISLGQEGVQYAHDDSLAYIQKKVRDFVEPNSMAPVLIPKHALTVTVAIGDWKVGNSPQEFLPVYWERKEGDFFTYRMLSKHDQATFYNCDGVEYLIGVCYYLQLRESRLITTHLDSGILSYAILGMDFYPPRNRFETEMWRCRRAYGRYCKAAGKRVCVWWPEGKDPVHTLYNLHTREKEYEDCEECREEAKNYKFVEVEKEAPTSPPVEDIIATPIVEKLEEMKLEEVKEEDTETLLKNYIAEIEKGFPTTCYPTINPKVLEKTVGWKIVGQGTHFAGISIGQEDVQHAHVGSLAYIRNMVRQIEEKKNDKDLVPISLPKNVLTVSVPFCDDWKCGNSCQEFLPVNMELKEGGFFTYRMLTKNLQATLYNYDGVEYGAGFCYYLQLRENLLITVFTDHCVFNNILGSAKIYPPTDRYEDPRWKSDRQYERYCKTAGKQVCVSWPENGQPVHVSTNLRTGEVESKDCEECREEAKTYNIAKEAETPTSPPVEDTIATPTPIVEELEEFKVEDVKKEEPLSDDDFEFLDYSSD